MIDPPDEIPLSPSHSEIFSLASDIRLRLAGHFLETLDNSNINPQHDAIFGLASYALQILIESIEKKPHSKVCGRIELRSILDILIILTYLIKKNDTILWQKYRDYGTGQAKLAFLQIKEGEENKIPSYIDTETLGQLANEDKWQEYVPINLGDWNQSNI